MSENNKYPGSLRVKTRAVRWARGFYKDSKCPWQYKTAGPVQPQLPAHTRDKKERGGGVEGEGGSKRYSVQTRPPTTYSQPFGKSQKASKGFHWNGFT